MESFRLTGTRPSKSFVLVREERPSFSQTEFGTSHAGPCSFLSLFSPICTVPVFRAGSNGPLGKPSGWSVRSL
jgi:hypothetical protein